MSAWKVKAMVGAGSAIEVGFSCNVQAVQLLPGSTRPRGMLREPRDAGNEATAPIADPPVAQTLFRGGRPR